MTFNDPVVFCHQGSRMRKTFILFKAGSLIRISYLSQLCTYIYTYYGIGVYLCPKTPENPCLNNPNNLL